MPFALDNDILLSSDLKMLDIGKPPTKSIPMQEFPKMVYLHPKDKTKEHMPKTVQSLSEQEAALAQGYRTRPHIPVAPAVDLSKDYDVEFEAVEEKRGPGRPRTAA